MNKKEIFKKFLMVVFLISFTLVGYLSVSKITSREANSWGCCGCLCIAGGFGSSITFVGTTIVAEIQAAAAEIVVYLGLRTEYIIGSPLYPANPTGVLNTITDTRDHINRWINAFWYRSLEPALGAMAEQITVMNADQSRTISSFLDAATMMRMVVTYENERLRSHREKRRGDNTIVMATMVGGLGRSNAFRKAYSAVAPTENEHRSSNYKNLPSGAGSIRDMSSRWDIYTGTNGKYCQKDDNNGAAGCDGGDKIFAGQDIDVAGTVFSHETIDFTNPDTKKTIDNLIANIAEPFVSDLVPASAVNSVDGHKAILEREEYKAKRQVIYDALYYVVSRRAPGSGIGAFTKEIREDAGVDISRISNNPSYNEVLHVLTSERARSGKYALDQINEPEVNERELIIQQALQLIQLNDQLDLLDRLSLVLAAQVGAEVRDAKAPGAALSGVSLQ